MRVDNVDCVVAVFITKRRSCPMFRGHHSSSLSLHTFTSHKPERKDRKSQENVKDKVVCSKFVIGIYEILQRLENESGGDREIDKSSVCSSLTTLLGELVRKYDIDGDGGTACVFSSEACIFDAQWRCILFKKPTDTIVEHCSLLTVNRMYISNDAKCVLLCVPRIVSERKTRTDFEHRTSDWCRRVFGEGV